MSGPMRLRAEDEDDLRVISGFLQDSIVPMGEMCFLPQDNRFVLVANRFKWETAVEEAPPEPPVQLADVSYDDDEGDDILVPFERTNCGVCFDGVTAVRTRGLDLRERRQMLALLALEASSDGVTLHFSGGGCIHLDAVNWVCRLQDIGEPWPTSRRPEHPAE
ncbi:hypothetical protein N825_15100 [Skermanella stibiiresistens SB22]|uniref:DUF2948 domain-containing protein n=1 Tax=Skermanella stibiiresistens SB22 TaxID=1385369 RepID=W9GVQ1_9PROT|nr:DUF2948 family protein [Skermanella stibiiresistens]EWY37980.1 hypothetical protein N825_15100 [Skermanella stibiiresistens SB22]